MSNAVENYLLRGRLSSLYCILLRVPIQEDIQFRHFSNPAAVYLAVELDGELHKYSLSPIVGGTSQCWLADEGAPSRSLEWRYRPLLVNGKPVVKFVVAVSFGKGGKVR